MADRTRDLNVKRATSRSLIEFIVNTKHTVQELDVISVKLEDVSTRKSAMTRTDNVFVPRDLDLLTF